MEIVLPGDLDVSIITVAPKQAFYDWAIQLSDLDESEKELELEDLKNDTSSFVVPPIESVEDFQAILEENYEVIFNNELYSWSQNPETWPKDLSLELFNEWFAVSLHSMAYSLCPEDEGDH